MHGESSLKNPNNGYSLGSGGCSVALSCAPGPWNRVALYSAEPLNADPGTGPGLGERPHTRGCARACLLGVPRHARPPISRNTEAGANCWGGGAQSSGGCLPPPLGRAPPENDNVLLQAPPRRLGRSTRMAADVGTGPLAACGTLLSANRCGIVPCSSVLTFAQLPRVLFLCSAARVAES